MSRHAAQACEASGTPRLVFTRPPWRRQAGDLWTEVDTMSEAAAALGTAPRHVFLTQGRLQLGAFAEAPQHRYLVRAIERPADIEALPDHRLILSRGPFDVAGEEDLMRREAIDILVSKNSGGAATYAKIEAARNLGPRVVMVRRPAKPASLVTTDLKEALAWIEAHRAAS
jgi:precorrin-6A/cobalt-precorrin-6A reductase